MSVPYSYTCGNAAPESKVVICPKAFFEDIRKYGAPIIPIHLL